ncbi:type I iodothyronine deiodinase-like [Ruditapes philippinarum]|uniref:type I iodothyronine deiodinase-like n=1 Tax=Ruditapes philippinarum TaxID=129788 RepID=UPI00295BC075|nr:type I iodothyronine deiodinase-like [Ruditapes philippinarum]
MAKLPEYNKLVQEFAQIADFVTVYTAEAHPLDEWALLDHEKFSRLQHSTIEERMSSANVLKSEGLVGELVVESMENRSADVYASLPERLYVILDGKIVFKGGLGPFDYRPEAVRKWIHGHQTIKD